MVLLGVFFSLWLGGCSTVRLAYSQAPNLTYWWVDGFVDLNDDQSVQLRKDIRQFLDWHAFSEMPQYADRLLQWQDLIRKDSSDELACGQFQAMRQAYLRGIERSVEPLTRLAVSLTPVQWTHLQRHQVKSNQRFADDRLSGSPAQRHKRALKKAVDRYETLYGSLTDTQAVWLSDQVARSSFDPQRTQAERLRRQTDLLATLKTAKADPAHAADGLRAWHARVMHSPTPGFAAYSEQLIKEGCAQFAGLHNQTSAKQRAHAVNVLQGYEVDLRAASAQP